MHPLYTELQWLPRPESNFSAALKLLASAQGPIGRELQQLALPALDLNQLTKVARVIEKIRRAAPGEGPTLDPLVPFRLAVLSNSTIEMIVPALIASAARHGIALEIIQPSYDQVAQEALTPDSQSEQLQAGRRAPGHRLSVPCPSSFPSATVRRPLRRSRAPSATCRRCATASSRTPMRYASSRPSPRR